ncbi:MAG: CheR family methyltransferase, partial [bacterium]
MPPKKPTIRRITSTGKRAGGSPPPGQRRPVKTSKPRARKEPPAAPAARAAGRKSSEGSGRKKPAERAVGRKKPAGRPAGKKKTTGRTTSKKKPAARGASSAKPDRAVRRTQRVEPAAKTAGGRKTASAPPPAGDERGGTSTPAGGASQAKSDERLLNAGSKFPVVGIGASAGGLEAMRELFDKMPTNTHMAFVVITHHHPGHVTMLPELLGKVTKIPVIEIEDGIELQPNRVFVATGKPVTIENNILHEVEQTPVQRPPLPVDIFFRSLAEDRKHLAICIVLSGTGTDGSLGLRAIKAEGGLTIVQETQTARYTGMPSSAIATAQADRILPVGEMPQYLVAYAQSLSAPGAGREEAGSKEAPESELQEVFRLIRARTGHDFHGYKTNTLRRRIDRRMTVHCLTDIQAYVRFLKTNPLEVDSLFKELLVGVTSFFRDPQAFESLADNVLPTLMSGRRDGTDFRVWVVGGGTGEEAYTVSILLDEMANRFKKFFKFQVFSTDLDEDAIALARVGRYPEGIANDVPPDKLEHYFEKENGTYRISKRIRDMVIFAPQNVISDPPFTKLDLVACRNVMIYMNSELQKQLLPLFHYSLKPNGILMLGPSESIGGHNELFETLSKKYKIYRRREGTRETLPGLPLLSRKSELRTHFKSKAPDSAVHQSRFGEPTEHLLLDRFVPLAVLVNRQFEVVYVHGRTGLYLELAAGRPPWNITDMAREGLREHLVSILRQVTKKGGEIVRRGVSVKSNGGWTEVDLSATMLLEPENMAGLILVTFRTPERGGGADDTNGLSRGDRDANMEKELQDTRHMLQTTVEELEASNEELRSTNEELQSANEELQSINEELETSKEELQS